MQGRHSQLIKELLKLFFEKLDSIHTAKVFLLSQSMLSLIPLKERERVVLAQSYEELLEVCSGKFRWYDSMALEELFEFIRINGLETETKHLKHKILLGVRQFFEGHDRIIRDPYSSKIIVMVDSYLGQSDSDEYMIYKLYQLASRAVALENDCVLQLQETQHKKDKIPAKCLNQVGNLPPRMHKTSLTKRRRSSSTGESLSDFDANIDDEIAST